MARLLLDKTHFLPAYTKEFDQLQHLLRSAPAGSRDAALDANLALTAFEDALDTLVSDGHAEGLQRWPEDTFDESPFHKLTVGPYRALILDRTEDDVIEALLFLTTIGNFDVLARLVIEDRLS